MEGEAMTPDGSFADHEDLRPSADPQERERAEFEQCYPLPEYGVKANGLGVTRSIHYNAHKREWRAFQQGWQAARREERKRTREYLKKLGWSDADIGAWERWEQGAHQG